MTEDRGHALYVYDSGSSVESLWVSFKCVVSSNMTLYLQNTETELVQKEIQVFFLLGRLDKNG